MTADKLAPVACHSDATVEGCEHFCTFVFEIYWYYGRSPILGPDLLSQLPDPKRTVRSWN
jgi:hypothetical protein